MALEFDMRMSSKESIFLRHVPIHTYPIIYIYDIQCDIVRNSRPLCV